VNTALGRRVLNHLTWHRDQLDTSGRGRHDRERGTIASLAGWTLLLSGYTLPPGGEYQRPDGTAVGRQQAGDEAAALLGLTDAQRDGGGSPLFGEMDRDKAIARLRALVEAAETTRDPGRQAAASRREAAS
jgi:hypothetical protein